MDLNIIKKKIEKIGYKVSLVKESFFIAGIPGERDDETGIGTLRTAFHISVASNKILLEYPYYQIDIEKEFDDFEKLAEFLREKFPLKKAE